MVYAINEINRNGVPIEEGLVQNKPSQEAARVKGSENAADRNVNGSNPARSQIVSNSTNTLKQLSRQVSWGTVFSSLEPAEAQKLRNYLNALENADAYDTVKTMGRSQRETRVVITPWRDR